MQDISIGYGPMIALKQDRAGPIGAIKSRSRAPLAEVADIPPVLLAELDPQRLGLVGILLVESLERLAIGLAIADVLILIDRLAVPDQRELLPFQCDVEGLPGRRAASPGSRGKGPLIEGAAVVKTELGFAETVEDLDFEEPAVVDSRVAPFGNIELEVELIVGERSPTVMISEPRPSSLQSMTASVDPPLPTGTNRAESIGSSRTERRRSRLSSQPDCDRSSPSRSFPLNKGLRAVLGA